MKAHRRGWAALAAVTVGLSGCTASEPAQESAAVNVDGGAGWTVLQYSMADNDLEPFMMEDLTELGGVPRGGGLALTAFADRAAGYSSDGVLGLPDWEGAKVFDIEDGAATVVAELGNVNTGDPALLTAFLADGIARHPNEHYALVISDHGAAWPGIGGDESTPDGDSLDLAELTEAIGAGLEQAGVDKLDFLGFDACLMASYEVASAMAPFADTMVASQELEPGHGWDYASFGVLTEGATSQDLGQAVIDGFQAQATASGTQDEITLSMIDLTQMPALDEAVADLAAALSASATVVAPEVGRLRATNLGFGRSPDPVQDTQMTDLGLLVAKIDADTDSVDEPAQALLAALEDTVVRSLDSPTTLGATGLSIYFPPTEALLSSDYAAVTSAAPWASFLSSYYNAGQAIPASDQAAFTSADETAEVFFDEDGANLTGTFSESAEANLTEATISYGIVGDDGSVTYFGEEPAEISDDGSQTALGIYDLTRLVMSDGEDAVTAYLTLDYEDGDEIASIDVPMAYYAAGDLDGETYQDVLLTLTFDPDTGDILNETYYAYDDELGTYGELTADAEGVIVPEILRLTADGEQEWVASGETGLYADLEAITYDFQPLETGTLLQLDLSVFDFGGNSDTISARVEVP